MLNPYFLMAVLYLSLTLLGALDNALINLNLLPMFSGIRWLRIHFITLGALSQAIFGALPLILAMRAGLPRPKTRWDIWLALNLGLLALLIGIPLVNAVLMTAGGTLIFIAAVLLMAHLWQMRAHTKSDTPRAGRKFYVMGLGYLLLGIIIGTGLWQGWGVALQIKTPIEVHVHANAWGFTSLVFAGLIVDLYPQFAGRSLRWPRSITPIFWIMSLGAALLVAGPWVGSNLFSVPGVILHTVSTVWLLLNVIKPLLGDRKVWSPGLLHLVTSYAWILLPVLVAPLIIIGVPGFPGAGIEANAPQALVYGWMLQFGYAIIPYLMARILTPHLPAKLGGTWLSLLAAHAGSAFLWASIFLRDQQAALQGVAYGLWLLSLLPILWQGWRILQAGVTHIEASFEAAALTEPAPVETAAD